MGIYAYLRVSTDKHGQSTENQRIAIRDAGITVDEYFHEEGVSGSVAAEFRPGFSRMINMCQKGDTVVCTAVDRIGRNAADVLRLAETLQTKGVHFIILQFGTTDVTSPMGKAIMGVVAVFAELEKSFLIERTKAGLKRTREQGTKLGAPLKITPAQLTEMCKMRQSGISDTAIAQQFELPRNTVKRNLDKWYNMIEEYKFEYELRQAQYESNRNK